MKRYWCAYTPRGASTHILLKKGKHKNGTQFKKKHFSLTLTFKHTFFYSYITLHYPLQLFSAVKNKISRKRKAAQALKANYRGYRGLFRSKNRTAYISETDEFIKLGNSVLTQNEPIFQNKCVLNTYLRFFLDFNTTYETTCTTNIGKMFELTLGQGHKVKGKGQICAYLKKKLEKLMKY